MIEDMTAEKSKLTSTVELVEKMLVEREGEIHSLKAEASVNAAHSVMLQCSFLLTSPPRRFCFHLR